MVATLISAGSGTGEFDESDEDDLEDSESEDEFEDDEFEDSSPGD